MKTSLFTLVILIMTLASSSQESLQWTKETNHANMAISGDKLFVMGEEDLTAYNLKNGNIDWTIPSPLYGYITTSLVTHDNTLFGLGSLSRGSEKFVYAWNQKDGTELWKSQYPGEWGDLFFMGVTQGKFLYYGNIGVFALDIAAGGKAFSIEKTSERPAYEADGIIYMPNYKSDRKPVEHWVSTYDLKGKLIDKTMAFGDTVIERVTYSDPEKAVVISSINMGWSRSYFLDRKANRLLWEGKKIIPYQVIGKKTIEADKDGVICYDFRTGKELWKFDMVSPVFTLINKTHVYLGYKQGQVVKLDLETGTIVWQKNMEKPVLGAVLSESTLVVSLGIYAESEAHNVRNEFRVFDTNNMTPEAFLVEEKIRIERDYVKNNKVPVQQLYFDAQAKIADEDLWTLCLTKFMVGKGYEWCINDISGKYQGSEGAGKHIRFSNKYKAYDLVATDSIDDILTQYYNFEQIDQFLEFIETFDDQKLIQEGLNKKYNHEPFEATPDKPYMVLNNVKHLQRVSKALYTPNGKEIVTASWDKTIRVWDAANGDLKRVIRVPAKPGSEGQIYCMAMSPDGKFLAAAGYSVGAGDMERYGNDYVLLIDYTTGKIVDLFAAHGQAIFSLSFSGDGKYLVSGGGTTDNTVWFYKVEPKEEFKKLQLHGGAQMSELVSGLAPIKGTHDFMACDFNGFAARVFAPKADSIGNVVGPPQAVNVAQSPGKIMKMGSPAYNSISTDPQGKVAALATSFGVQIISTDTAQGLYMRVPAWILKPVSATAFSADGKRIVVAAGEEIRIFAMRPIGDTLDPEQLSSFTLHNNTIFSVAFSPDGKHVVSSGGNENQVYVWDAATGKLAFELGGEAKTARIWALGSHKTNPGILAFGTENNLGVEKNNLGTLAKGFDLSNLTLIEKINPDDFVSAHSWNQSQNVSAPYFPAEFYTGEMQSYTKLSDGTVVVGTDYSVYATNKDGKYEQLSYSGIRSSAVATSADNKFFFAGQVDGRIEIFSQRTKKLMATLYIAPNREWILWTPEGYYTASRRGAKLAGWQVNPWTVNVQDFSALNLRQRGGILRMMIAHNPKYYPFEQFDVRLNRPDIVLSKLGIASREKAMALKQAYLKRLTRLGINENSLSAKLAIPTLSISEIPAQTKERFLNLNVKATDETFPVQRIHVLINDVPLYGLQGFKVASDTIRKVQKQFKIELTNGRSKIQISAVNSAGIESLKETFYISCNSTMPQPRNRYLVAIGVSEYSNTDFNLRYAAKDASDVVAACSAYQGYFGATKVLRITDKEATRESILKAREFLAQAKTNDQVILFVAGHGLLDKKLDWYFATTDIDFNNPSARGIAYHELEEILDGIAAREKIMFMDACHSGEVDKEEIQIVNIASTQNGTVNSRGFKANVLEKKTGMGLQNSFELMQQLFADISRGSGAMVISSAGGTELAFESPLWNNGVFTYSLLLGLKTKNADANKDGKIQVSEIRDFVIDNVQSLTQGLQTPTSRKENLEFDFRVW